MTASETFNNKLFRNTASLIKETLFVKISEHPGNKKALSHNL